MQMETKTHDFTALKYNRPGRPKGSRDSKPRRKKHNSKPEKDIPDSTQSIPQSSATDHKRDWAHVHIPARLATETDDLLHLAVEHTILDQSLNAFTSLRQPSVFEAERAGLAEPALRTPEAERRHAANSSAGADSARLDADDQIAADPFHFDWPHW